MGLRVHRWLQYLATISTTVIAGVILGSMDTWDQLKANSVRMESVPGDVRAIKEDVNGIRATSQNHEWRIGNLEHQKP